MKVNKGESCPDLNYYRPHKVSIQSTREYLILNIKNKNRLLG